MKASIYNTILNIERYTLVYNSWTDRTVCMRKGVVNVHDLTSINDSTIRQQLCDIGAIIEDDIDETGRLSGLINQTDNNEHAFHLHINPTLDCNFNCWYCYENHLVGSKMDKEVLYAVFKLVDKVFAEKNQLKFFSLSFFGGEPLLYYKQVAKPLIEYISTVSKSKDVRFNVHFTSNGFLLNDAMIEYLKQYDCSFQITFDGHRPLHDKTRCTALGHGSYDKILSNVAKLTHAGIHVVSRINFTSDNIDSVPEIAEDMKLFGDDAKQHLSIDLQHVWQDIKKSTQDDIDETIETLATKFNEIGLRATTHLTRESVRFSCYGDKHNHVLINFNGDVHRCTARDFTSENSHGTLLDDGSIKWKDDKLKLFKSCKFSRPECHTCRVAPLCGGGCRQAAMERQETGSCMFGRTDADIDHMVLKRIESMIH